MRVSQNYNFNQGSVYLKKQAISTKSQYLTQKKFEKNFSSGIVKIMGKKQTSDDIFFLNLFNREILWTILAYSWNVFEINYAN